MMNTDDTWTAPILAQVLGPVEPWMSCDDCFDQSDAYLDDLLDRNASMPPGFRTHLLGCPACRDEIETLAELAAVDRGLDPATGRKRVDAQIEPAEDETAL